MRIFYAAFLCVSLLAGCDLHPRIVALPDTVGDFISARYPALLADPVGQADIYNSAATDYGVYASPELYGTSSTDDYVLYASVDDYIVPPAVDTARAADTPADTGAEIFVDAAPAPATTDIAPIAQATAPTDTPDVVTLPDLPMPDDVISVPMYGGTDDMVTVAAGDTLYAIARKYGTTVEDLAAANNLAAPYALRVGQKLHITTPADTITIPARPTTPIVPVPDKTAAETKTPAKTLPMPAQSAPKVAQTVTPQPKPAPVAPIGTPTTTRVDVTEVTVVPGDTLYSISRKYSVPVNDLAVMNNLAAPFALYAGQRVRVPNLATAKVKDTTTITPTTPTATSAPSAASASTQGTATAQKPAAKNSSATTGTTPAKTNGDKPATKQDATKTAQTTNKTKTNTTTTQQKEKISSDPSKKLPTIAARSSSKFSWPVRGSILSNYGAKSNGLFNDGINISATRGTTVKAAENGVVAYAGNEVKGMGNLIIIQHADGWMTVYAHLDTLGVRRGAKVTVGQKIGTVGQTGKVDKPQLHFEIRKGTKAYNPSQYLKK